MALASVRGRCHGEIRGSGSPKAVPRFIIGTTQELTVYSAGGALRLARFLSGRSEINLGRAPDWAPSLPRYAVGYYPLAARVTPILDSFQRELKMAGK
jgi:hypothetical protein